MYCFSGWRGPAAKEAWDRILLPDTCEGVSEIALARKACDQVYDSVLRIQHDHQITMCRHVQARLCFLTFELAFGDGSASSRSLCQAPIFLGWRWTHHPSRWPLRTVAVTPGYPWMAEVFFWTTKQHQEYPVWRTTRSQGCLHVPVTLRRCDTQTSYIYFYFLLIYIYIHVNW